MVHRADTAASVSHLVGLLRKAQNLPAELRVLDLCTGTGCIPLLFQHELHAARSDVRLHALGVDVSTKALQLAQHNRHRLHKNESSRHRAEVAFLQADLLVDPFAHQTAGPLPLKTALNFTDHPRFWDIVVSNPPYMSPSAYWRTTTRSVRGFEPKLALVPPHRYAHTDNEQGDMFYPQLLNIARDVEAKIVLLEVADLDQALRVAQLAQRLEIFDGVEIWRDQPSAPADETTLEQNIPVHGQGNARTVICWRSIGAAWLGEAHTAVSPTQDSERLMVSWGWGYKAALRDADLEPRADPEFFKRKWSVEASRKRLKQRRDMLRALWKGRIG